MKETKPKKSEVHTVESKIRIGEKIRLLRKKNDVTQDKLAYYLGVTPQAVSKWENDISSPDITLRTTLIAGFPSETAEEFTELCEMVKELIPTDPNPDFDPTEPPKLRFRDLDDIQRQELIEQDPNWGEDKIPPMPNPRYSSAMAR